MRGSPLFRTLLLVALLAVAGLGLVRLTGGSPSANPVAAAKASDAAGAPVSVPFELALATTAAEVRILTADDQTLFESRSESVRLNGKLELPASTTALVLQIRWAADAPGHRFAKLTLEVPKRPTLRHTFDASGDIDDVWDLPDATPPAHDD